MDFNAKLVRIAAIMSTLYEVDGPAPASSIYMALNCDMELYENLIHAAVQMGWIKRNRNHTLELTESGKVQAQKFNSVMKK